MSHKQSKAVDIFPWNPSIITRCGTLKNDVSFICAIYNSMNLSEDRLLDG